MEFLGTTLLQRNEAKGSGGETAVKCLPTSRRPSREIRMQYPNKRWRHGTPNSNLNCSRPLPHVHTSQLLSMVMVIRRYSRRSTQLHFVDVTLASKYRTFHVLFWSMYIQYTVTLSETKERRLNLCRLPVPRSKRGVQN